MSRSIFRVLFYANGSKEKNGIVPLMGRVTINGTVAQFSCKQTISKELWDAKGNKAKGKAIAQYIDYRKRNDLFFCMDTDEQLLKAYSKLEQKKENYQKKNM